MLGQLNHVFVYGRECDVLVCTTYLKKIKIRVEFFSLVAKEEINYRSMQPVYNISKRTKLWWVNFNFVCI